MRRISLFGIEQKLSASRQFLLDNKFKLLYIILSLIVVINKAVDNFRPLGK